MTKVYEGTENGVTTKKAAQLTDTMQDTLTKLSRQGFAFAGASTWKALLRRGLVTANTAPRGMTKGVWCHYMLTDEGRKAVGGEMDARIGHVTDARDTRPVFEIMYRRYQDPRTSFLRVQADNVREAMSALTAHVGSTQYVVTSVQPVECPDCSNRVGSHDRRCPQWDPRF